MAYEHDQHIVWVTLAQVSLSLSLSLIENFTEKYKAQLRLFNASGNN